MNADQIEHIVRFYIEESDSADMRTYGGAFLENYSRAVHSIQNMMTLGSMRSVRALDLGCGFGWHALIIALIGDNEVVANDVRELMILNIQKRLAAVRERFEVNPRITTLLGDFTELNIEPKSFDAIFCEQTIEHVHDLDACFRKAYTVLKPGGFLLVGNDNNCLTRAHLASITQMWEKRDSSWEFIEELKKERPEENRDIRPYADMRRDIVREAAPDMDDDTLAILVRATSGQVRAEIIRSTDAYLARGVLPTPPPFAWCRNPLTGEYCERQFDPFVLKQEMRRIGFRVKLLQDFRRGGPLRIMTRVDIPLMNRLVFRRRPRFILAGRKL